MGIPEIDLAIDNQAAAFVVAVFGERKLRAAVKRGMQRGLFRIHEALPEYPPPPRMQAVTRRSSRFRSARIRGKGAYAGRRWIESYKRTGTLGKSITTRVDERGDGVQGVIGTAVARTTAASGYAEFVIGMPDEQAWMHRGRWWSLGAEVERNADAAADEIASEIDNVLNGG